MNETEALRLAEAMSLAFPGNLGIDKAAAELRRLSAIEAQRDALLEALKKLDNFFETYRPEDHPVSDPHELVRAAIQSVEENPHT